MTSEELNSYYKKLSRDEEDKKHFVQNEVESEEESESEEEKVQVKVLQPRKKTKQNLDSELLAKLLSSQEEYLKLNKKLFVAKSERDKEELEHRYTKLELNNKMVDLEKYKDLYQESRAFWKKVDLVIIIFVVVFLRFFFKC